MSLAVLKSRALTGMHAPEVTVEVHLANGLPQFTIVGLPDKAVAESRERVQATLDAIGLTLPPRRVVVNLSPADLPKEGSHYDLPIALGLMAAIGAIPPDALSGFTVLGELKGGAMKFGQALSIFEAALKATA